MTKLIDLPETDDDDTISNSKELSFLTNILNMKKKNPTAYHKTFKYVIFATIIFIALSNPLMDKVIKIAMPFTESWLFLLIIKTVLFFLIYYIIFQNLGV